MKAEEGGEERKDARKGKRWVEEWVMSARRWQPETRQELEDSMCPHTFHATGWPQEDERLPGRMERERERQRERREVGERARHAQEVQADNSNPPISSSLIISTPLMAVSKLETSPAQYDTRSVTHTHIHTHTHTHMGTHNLPVSSVWTLWCWKGKISVKRWVTSISWLTEGATTRSHLF